MRTSEIKHIIFSNLSCLKHIIGFAALSGAFFTSCIPVCRLQDSTLKVVRYDRSVKVYTAEGVNQNCLCSFYSDYRIGIGDTIKVKVVKFGDLANGTPATIKVK